MSEGKSVGIITVSDRVVATAVTVGLGEIEVEVLFGVEVEPVGENMIAGPVAVESGVAVQSDVSIAILSMMS